MAEMIFQSNSMSLFMIVLFASLFNAGLLLLAEKWGFSDWYTAKRKRWMPERCDFCVCFWLAVLELGYCYVNSPLGFDLWNLIMVAILALCSAVLSRFVL